MPITKAKSKADFAGSGMAANLTKRKPNHLRSIAVCVVSEICFSVQSKNKAQRFFEVELETLSSTQIILRNRPKKLDDSSNSHECPIISLVFE